VAGALWTLRPEAEATDLSPASAANNPLELRSAFTFAVFFLAMLAISKLAVDHFGKSGVYSLAALMGLTDVDPFILSMTQSKSIAPGLAAVSVLIAASSNNAIKAVYAYFLAKGKSGLQSFLLLLALALLGLIPLFWI
jgi:uncharacterized membrane protein (DUF4010 family)